MEYFGNLSAGGELAGPHSWNKQIKKSMAFSVLTLLLCVTVPALGDSEGLPIDCAHSTITVYVYKTGILSTLAHNHEIEAPIEWGEVKGSEGSSVELRVNSSKLRVLDTEVSDGTRARIEATLQTEVLDVGRFPEIHFQSTEVEPSGTDHWIIHGNLDLHGQTHPISFEVALKNGLYEGTAVLKQSGFGITPVKVAGGTVKVKDEIKVAFSIALLK
jgi:polyisoprenoid-binding protein YceI